MEKSYLEIKVTFIHIVVLLVAVIFIGIFLFYLGYQAGKSSMKSPALKASVTKDQVKSDKIKIINKQEKKPTIKEEIKLHQPPIKKTTSQKKGTVNKKVLKREAYYSIQVGAFSSFTNARNYSEKFRKKGYPSEILTTLKNKKKLFRVRVGNFKDFSEAKKEKTKLEKMEKKKFSIVKSG